MNIGPDDVVTISSEVLAQEIAGEAFLLDLKSEQYFGLSEVGTRIWQLMQEGQKISSIRQQLLEEYDSTEDQINADLNDIVSMMADAGLVSVAAA